MSIFYICNCEERGDINMDRYIMCMIILPMITLLAGTLKYIKYKI